MRRATEQEAPDKPLCGVLAAVLLAACAAAPVRSTPGPVSQAPAPTVSLPAPDSSSPPSEAPPLREVDAPRATLEAACFALPWVPADQKHAAQPFSAATLERLRVLEAECRDTHPELPPARFGYTGTIPEPACHYGIARIYFHERRYVEAARRFRHVASEHADNDNGLFAAQFYLDTLDLLGSASQPQRPECHELMRKEALRFVCEYCERADTEDPCATFRRMAADGESVTPPACPP